MLLPLGEGLGRHFRRIDCLLAEHSLAEDLPLRSRLAQVLFGSPFVIDNWSDTSQVPGLRDFVKSLRRGIRGGDAASADLLLGIALVFDSNKVVWRNHGFFDGLVDETGGILALHPRLAGDLVSLLDVKTKRSNPHNLAETSILSKIPAESLRGQEERLTEILKKESNAPKERLFNAILAVFRNDPPGRRAIAAKLVEHDFDYLAMWIHETQGDGITSAHVDTLIRRFKEGLSAWQTEDDGRFRSQWRAIARAKSAIRQIEDLQLAVISEDHRDYLASVRQILPSLF